MSYISLKDILIGARQESHRMHHYFLGVEHMFIALLEVNNGISSNIIESYGFQPSYIIDAIRRKVGKGGKHRLWAGTPNTPRADIIMDIAHEIALDNGRNNIHEQDLLIAILEENENIPARVLRTLGLDTLTLIHDAKVYQPQANENRYFVQIELNPDADFSVDKDESYILRRMYSDCGTVYINNKIRNHVTNTTHFFVTPSRNDASENNIIIVRIDNTDSILDEVHRYERYLQNESKSECVVIEGIPIAPEASEYAGIQYKLPANSSAKLESLHDVILEWEPSQIADWLNQNLINKYNCIFGKDTRPLQIKASKDYAWLLPPLFELKSVAKSTASSNIPILTGSRNQPDNEIEKDQIIGIKNCFIKKVDKANKRLHLTFNIESDNNHAHDITLQNVDFRNNTHYRGESIDLLYGTLSKRRDELLAESVMALDPIFETSQAMLVYQQQEIPNPLIGYHDLLDTAIESTASTSHGNLQLCNIIVDSNNNAQLIDFSSTYHRHSLYDWAILELSLLTDYNLSVAQPQQWDDIWEVSLAIEALNMNTPYSEPDSKLSQSFLVIEAIRKIVQPYLATKDDWSEYFLVIALASLHRMTLKRMTLEGRRLMYLNSGLAMRAFHHYRDKSQGNDMLLDSSDLG